MPRSHYLDTTGASAQPRRVRGGRARRRRRGAHHQPPLGDLGRAHQRRRSGFESHAIWSTISPRRRWRASLLRPQDVVPIGGVALERPRRRRRHAPIAIIGAGHGPGRGRAAASRRSPLPAADRGRPRQFRARHAGRDRDPAAHCRAQFGRVSNERLDQRPGPGQRAPRAERHRRRGSRPAASRPTSPHARRKATSAACARIDVFCAVFGAAAGDLVLTLGAWDGVFLTGGLVPKLLSSIAALRRSASASNTRDASRR